MNNPESVVVEWRRWVTNGVMIEGRVYAHAQTVRDAKNFEAERENERAMTCISPQK